MSSEVLRFRDVGVQGFIGSVFSGSGVQAPRGQRFMSSGVQGLWGSEV